MALIPLDGCVKSSMAPPISSLWLYMTTKTGTISGLQFNFSVLLNIRQALEILPPENSAVTWWARFQLYFLDVGQKIPEAALLFLNVAFHGRDGSSD